MKTIGEHPLLDPSHFIDLTPASYLYWGAHSPALKRVEEAMVATYRAKSLGEKGRDLFYEEENRTREKIAALTGSRSSEVGLLGDASTAWSAIANGWTWRPGDNIIINEYEHPAVFAPFLRLRKYGLEVRVAKKDDDWEMRTTSIERCCDERTIAIAVSHVGYVTGLRNDLLELGEVANRVGVPLLVDISHSLGVLDVDLSSAAITVTASYKWALGPYGVGAVIWNQNLLPDFEPGTVGWRSLSNIFTEDRFEELNWNSGGARFQMGAPSFAGIAGLGAGLDTILGIGITNVEAHSLALVAMAMSGLRSLGLEVITPSDPARRAGSVAFLHDQGELFARMLADHGVLVWGGDGRVRASFHVMNSIKDVSRLISAVEQVLAKMPTTKEGSRSAI